MYFYLSLLMLKRQMKNELLKVKKFNEKGLLFLNESKDYLKDREIFNKLWFRS